MIHESGAVGPPGYGGASEGTVGEQHPPEVQPPEREPEVEKSELGNPPSELEKPLDTEKIAERPLGVPVDQTE